MGLHSLLTSCGLAFEPLGNDTKTYYSQTIAKWQPDKIYISQTHSVRVKFIIPKHAIHKKMFNLLF
ncbi:MAG: hypothetical protein FD181_1270 [Prolixibacteraceae bacterium]|nr:MAG: hypothetical protein FD181_1270 [Prolixibacteraceae bacterium]